jgi:hypothetical protein
MDMDEFELNLKSINNRLEDEKFEAEKRANASFLILLREYFKQFNLKNHHIGISSGMGSANLFIRNKRTGKQTESYDFNTWHHEPEIYKAMEYIEENCLDWDLTWNLDDELIA